MFVLKLYASGIKIKMMSYNKYVKSNSPSTLLDAKNNMCKGRKKKLYGFID